MAASLPPSDLERSRVSSAEGAAPEEIRLQLPLDELRAVLNEFSPDSGMRIVAASDRRVVVAAGPAGLEPRLGGTISGPAIFKLVDYSAFLAVNAYAGRVLTAVLTNCAISFLEAADPGPLLVEIEPVKIGRRMAVMSARTTDADDQLIAVATLQFALPGRQTNRIRR